MVETADLTFAVAIQDTTVHIQVVESNMRGGERQCEQQRQSYETVFVGVPAEQFTQHADMVP